MQTRLTVAAALLALLAGSPPARAAGLPAGPDPFADDFDDADVDFPDPFEPVNRRVLHLNGWIESLVLDPLANAYAFVVPGVARDAFRRFFWNLNEPGIAINDALQGEPSDAAMAGGRFLVNSTVGVAGLFDPAAKLGLTRHEADFGQTLALYGTPSGPYLVLPLLGPTTVRDGVGFGVDMAFNPATYVFFFIPVVQIIFPTLQGPATSLLMPTLHGGSAGIVTWDAHRDAVAALRESSVDYYAALRSAYSQNREAQIWSRRGHPDPATARSDQPPDRRSCARRLQGPTRGRFAGAWRCTPSA